MKTRIVTHKRDDGAILSHTIIELRKHADDDELAYRVQSTRVVTAWAMPEAGDFEIRWTYSIARAFVMAEEFGKRCERKGKR